MECWAIIGENFLNLFFKPILSIWNVSVFYSLYESLTFPSVEFDIGANFVHFSREISTYMYNSIELFVELEKNCFGWFEVNEVDWEDHTVHFVKGRKATNWKFFWYTELINFEKVRLGISTIWFFFSSNQECRMLRHLINGTENAKFPFDSDNDT